MSAQLLSRRGCTASDHESKLADGAISRVKVTGTAQTYCRMHAYRISET